MANDALKELENLNSLGQQGIDAAANQAKLSESRQDFVAPAGEDAGFATPEALATAVGAGWLLGPVGGILMGVAQGILGQREQKAALAQFNQRTNALGDANDIFNSELDRLAASATNPNDIEQLSAMQTQKDAALRMMVTPGLEEQGQEEFGKFTTRLNDYTLTQEQQRIDAEVLDAQLQRELDQEQYSRYNTSIGNFRAESQPYLDVMQATDIALDALTNGTPADLWAASILINKALDPTGVVRQEEAEAIGALGSIWDKANVWLEKARSGQTILPDGRKELTDLLYSMRGSVSEYQGALEARYSDEVNDIGLPPKYHDNFRLARTVPASVQGDMKNVKTLPLEDIDKAAADALYPYSDAGIKNNLKYLWAETFGGIDEDEKKAKRQQARERNMATGRIQ